MLIYSVLPGARAALAARRFNALQNPASRPERHCNKKRETKVQIDVMKSSLHLIQTGKYAGFTITLNIFHAVSITNK